jgi:hypothetical protein
VRPYAGQFPSQDGRLRPSVLDWDASDIPALNARVLRLFTLEDPRICGMPKEGGGGRRSRRSGSRRAIRFALTDFDFDLPRLCLFLLG